MFVPTRTSEACLGIEDDEPIVTLAGRHVPFVTQTQAPNVRFGRSFVIVLDKETQRALGDAARLAAQRHAERVRRAGQEGGDRSEVKRACALTEIIVQKLPVLAAELQRMRAVKPT